MISSILVACVLAANPDAVVSPDLAAYKEAKAQAGRNTDAHIRLALWCEARGMNAERTKHLTIATLIDPANATARGLLGMVQYKGKWLSPDAVAEQLRNDPQQQAIVREYLERRAKTPDKADNQNKLALWCEENGLKDQAQAHFHRTVQLDPGREQAWKHLGYKKEKGRWAKPEQVAAEKELIEVQVKANKHWKPILEKLWKGLTSRIPDERAKAETALTEIHDPAAVPMIWQTFAQKDSRHQQVGVGLFGQIDAPASSQALAMLSIAGRSADVRREAVVILKQRDPRDFVTVLVDLIRKPIEYEIRRKAGLNSPGELFVKGVDQNLRRVYTPLSTPNYSPQPGDTYGYDANGLPVVNRYLGSDIQFLGWLGQPQNSLNASPPGSMNFNISPGVSSDSAAALLTKAGLPVDQAKHLAATIQAASSPSFLSNVGQLSRGNIERGNYMLFRGFDETLNIPVGQMAIDAQRSAQVAQQRLDQDVQQIEGYNGPIRELNRKARQSLADTANVDLGDDPEAWQRWSTDLMGFAAAATNSSTQTPTMVEEVPLNYQPQASPSLLAQPNSVTIIRQHSCFAAGTSVRTVNGLQAIETLQAGDEVLIQDTKLGRIAFSPIINTFHNPPNYTLKISFAGKEEPIVATGIHRFWKAGQGWIMARDLNAGDVLRTVGGSVTVQSVEADKKQPVFNLRVADGADFFVGEVGVLVHDNSLVTPAEKPFDRVTSTLTTADRN